MNRRAFLTRSGLALGALIVGDEVLETLARLTHVRKTFPSAAMPHAADRYVSFPEPELQEILRKVFTNIRPKSNGIGIYEHTYPDRFFMEWEVK